MKTTLLPILSLVFAIGVLCAQEPAKPPTKPDATTELKGAGAPYYAAVESVSADYQKWLGALETWYLGELDKLTGARAKLGDLDGAVAIKAERERIAAHAATTAEQIQAMPVPLRTLRMTYEQGVKRIADEGTRRIDVARRKYLADLEALQKRTTISGDIDQALAVKAEKERFIAEMAADPGTAVAQLPPPPVTVTNPSAPGTIGTAKVPRDVPKNLFGGGVDVLPAHAPDAQRKDGFLVTKKDAWIMSKGTFRPPVSITYIVKTDSQVRLRYAADEIIFNWERNKTELRIGGGPANGQHREGAGSIPVNKLITIRQIVQPDKMTISVDGEERTTWKADFSATNQGIGIQPSHGSTIWVKQILVHQIR